MAYRVKVCTLCLPIDLRRPHNITMLLTDGVDVVRFVNNATGVHPTVLHDIAKRAYPECYYRFTVTENLLQRLKTSVRVYTSDAYFSALLYIASLGNVHAARAIVEMKLGDYLEPGGLGREARFKDEVWRLYMAFKVRAIGSKPVDCIRRGVELYERGEIDAGGLKLLAAKYMGVRGASYRVVSAYALKDLLPRVFSIASELGVRPGVAVRLLHLAGCASS